MHDTFYLIMAGIVSISVLRVIITNKQKMPVHEKVVLAISILLIAVLVFCYIFI